MSTKFFHSMFRTSALALAAGGLLLTSPLSLSAYAQAAKTADKAADGKARYTKNEREIEGVKQTNLTKPPPPPKKEDKKGAPTLSLEDFVGQRQDKIQKLNDASIDKMGRLLKITGDDDPQKPEFHFRMAEAYSEKMRYFNFQARSLDQRSSMQPRIRKPA